MEGLALIAALVLAHYVHLNMKVYEQRLSIQRLQGLLAIKIRLQNKITVAAPLDHWTMLGIEPTKDCEKVEAAFKRIAKVYHPDMGGTAKAFQALQEAKNKALVACKGPVVYG